ncbi:glycosyl hydrolase [Pseudomonas sp. B1(2018)]|uniref:Ig-like domain-containing protein n=1 Tax=Pseudomonas sp. B1(2018) TaxID=2233856 RepID=UPI000D5C7583|nr:Ig-like domain-containing protein [Pseudomonas sp. B1(2018)]PVZ54348.1 glycosyl hydrolase [Pseudomonas sp. B1(2018)]
MWWSIFGGAKAKSRVTEGQRTPAAPMIMSLEPRMLFDGAVAATVADTAAQADNHSTADTAKAPTADHPTASKDTHGQADATPAASPVAVPGQSVVFVDSRVKDADSLLTGVAPGTQVVKLDAGKDGLQQIADYLDQHQGISSVQIIAHGNAGDLWLGDSYLSADNVAARSAVLAEIGKDINAGGDILIYGCYTAEGERGLSFVDSLAQMTGRDVAASNNRNGVGGDWDLEIATGNIESANALSSTAMSDYQWGLATWSASNNANTGVGSLRAAIASAQNGDIVTFNSGMTVQLTSELLINKNITVDGDLNNDGAADVILDGQYRTRVIEVAAGSTVKLDGLVITRGLVSGTGGNGGYAATGSMAGGIFNAGILTLNNVTVTSNAASGGGGGGGITGAFYGGGGGGGGGLGGQGGGHGGSAGPGTGTLGGGVGGGGVGGYGGGYDATHMGGRGGTTTGGAGGIGVSYYSSGGNGATATNGTISIGGGGGGAGWDKVGGAGGNAVGGIYNASSGTLTIVGTSTISNNIGAGGGGGGGGGQGSNASNGGLGGRGVGAIWNKGTLLMTAANFAALAGNAAASGAGGTAQGGGTTGTSPTSVATIYNDGGVLNTAYSPPPTATIVVSDNALKIGETSLVTITFSEAVTGFTNADLTIANGTLTAVSSSDGGITWTATFTPSASISDTTNVITLDNTGVINGLGTAGVGTTNSNNYTVDTVRPTASIVFADTALRIGETSLVTITFNEAVSGFTNADLTIANGTLTSVSSSDGGITWTGTFTPSASITDATNLITLDNTGVSDLAGNAGSGTTDSNNYAIDTVRPTATIVVTDNALKIGETSLVTITFSEAVSGFTNADLTIANGTLSAVSSSDGGITWTATLTPSSSTNDTTNLITLNNTGVSDLAGNAGSGTTDSNNYAIDTLRPTATIVVADNALKIGETSLVTITFSEAVSGFTNADLTIANGTLTAVSSSDGGITWTATFTPTASITDTTNLITLDNTGVADLAGNAGSGTTDSNNYAIDTVRPTATIVVTDTALRIGETSLVTITFSEAVSGFTNADLTIANGTLTAVSSSDGGITWTATFTPSASINDTTNLITLDNTGIADLAGNAGSGTTDSNNYAIDTVRPTATIVLADTTLAAGETSLVTITFSEAVSGFTNADLTIANGTLTAVSSSDGGITWTATFTPTVGVSDPSNVITLNNTGVTDIAGNTGSGTTNSGNYTIDTVLPTATIVVADNALKIGETSLVTITFSEAVSGFSNADLTIANGTLSAVSSSDGGITWTATFTPSSAITDSSNVITLDNSGVQNASGNAGSGTTDSNNYAIDTVRPTATIVVADSALAVGQTSVVTITFSEAVTGFTTADLTVNNGTLSSLSTSDNITYTATLTPTASITDPTNLITLDNTGVTDGAGNAGSGTTDSNNYAIDSQRPTATIVLADATLSAGETSLVTITFSEAVTGFDNSDLSIANGTLSAVSSSDGGITWTATFTPTVGVNDLSNVITLNNTGVTDVAGNTGSGTTNSGNYTIDTVLPTATIVVADNALKIGDTSLVTISFSEAVSGFTNADLTIANGTLTSVSSSDGGITWTATFTPTSAITDTSNVIILDNSGVQNASGNAGSGTTDSNNYAIDTVRPTATIVVADTALSIGETSLVTITFSEAVSGFTNADLTITNGTLTAVSSSDGGITWTATFTPSAIINDTSNLITLDNTGVSDLSGNAGSGTTDSNSYAIDTVRPTATIVLADTTLSAGETSLVTITFSEAVSGFDNADLSVPNGTLSAVSSSDGGITWTATFTPTAGISDASNVITLANTGVTDVAGNTGSGTTNSGNYTIDTVLPTATIVVADNTLKIGDTSMVTITFSEAVSGFTNADLTITNGTLSAVSSSDGGITWTATFTPTSAITDTSNVITLDNSGVQNASGNAGSGTTDSNNYAIDTVRPTATIVVADTALSIGETSLVTITFSEAVSGFTNADLTIANGTLSAVSSSDGGITWTATFTPSASIIDSSNVITLDNSGIADLAGNAGSGTTDSNNYTVDTLRPTATIVMADPTLSAGETTLVTITFSESVSGFTNADLSVPNGTLSAVSSSDGGITWTATFTPNVGINDTSNLIALDNTGIADLAGNAGTGTTNSANFTIDTVLPTATIVVADNALNIGESTVVTITFSEAVTGFTNADLTIANGTLSAVSSSDGGITWTATFTPTANITDASNLITLDNSGVQNASGNAGSGSTDSNNYAIDTVRPTATIVVADTALSVGETTLVTITFDEAVTGFTTADLSVANGTLSSLSSSDGGITWTATLTPTTSITDTSNVITLDNSGIADLAGNAGSGTTDSNNFSIDTQRPTATIVVADPTLSAGETTLVTITFSEPVSGFTNADLSVPNGTLSAVSSSDGGITWTATFTPNAAINDTSNLITLDNTGVADLAGNAGIGTTQSANFTIDTVLPTATIVIADNALNVGETSLVTITFSEAVNGFTNADLTIANGTLSAVSSSDGGITWTATFTPTANITDATNLITLDNSGVQNASGNAGSGSTDSNNYAIDTVRPTATIVVADTALNVGETSQVTITFSEAVSGFSNADLTIDNGTLSAVSSSDGGITWTATLTPLAAITDTSNLIRLDNSGVQDAAGNTGSGTTDSNNYAIDSQRPTATIVMADTDLRPGETTLVTITFNEAVNGFTNADLTVANGTLSGLSSSDGGVTWTATFTPTASITDTTNLITLDNTGVTDAAGNAGSGVTNSANYLVQTSVPTASIVIADTSLKAGETTLVTITFNEAVNGFSNADLSVANGTLSNVSSNDGGITWTAAFTPASNVTDASNLITLDNSGVANASGNTGAGTTDSNNFAIDTVLPTATIVVADTQLGIGETTTVTITFSEAVSGFDLSDISVANGTLSNLSSRDGGVTWTATLTPTANVSDATNLIVLDTGRVQDIAGNFGASIAISNNYALDATRPTVTIVVANPNLGIGQTTTVTFTFSEAVSDFDLSDLSVTNGDLSNLASSDGGKTWTATFTPTANVTDPSNFIALDTGNVTDLVGNTGNTVAVSNNYTLDSELPTATVVVANPDLGVGQTSQVTITFSEAVSGFDLSDISIANGTLSDLRSSDGGKTWTAMLTPTANVNIASNAIIINRAGISDMAGNSGSGVSQSDNFVINTVPTSSVVVVSPDPAFRTNTPVTLPDVPNVPLQPFVFTPPVGNLASPLTFQPLFEQRVIGNGIRPLGDIFMNHGALTPSFIAQVFTSNDSGGDGSGHGFLGFGGGDGGVFSTSTLSSLFNQDSNAERDSLNAFGSQSIKSGDVSQGLRGVFGAPTLGQQLQQLQDNEQQQVDKLAAALKLAGISEMQA